MTLPYIIHITWAQHRHQYTEVTENERPKNEEIKNKNYFTKKPAIVRLNELEILHRNARDILTIRFYAIKWTNGCGKCVGLVWMQKWKSKWWIKFAQIATTREKISIFIRVHSEWASEYVCKWVRMCVVIFVVVRQQPLIETGPVSTLTDFFFYFFSYSLCLLRRLLSFMCLHFDCTRILFCGSIANSPSKHAACTPTARQWKRIVGSDFEWNTGNSIHLDF